MPKIWFNNLVKVALVNSPLYIWHMYNRLVLLIFSIAALVQNGYAQIGGTASFAYLNTPIAARAAGAAGNVHTNTAGDVAFSMYNPALINQQMHGEMSFNVALLPAGVTLGEAAYSHTFSRAGSFSAGIKYVDYGSFLRTNVQSQVVGGFTAADYAFQMGYGYSLDSAWHVGASVKLINATYAGYSSWAVATDLATLYTLPKTNVAFALILSNIGMQLTKFDENRDPLPFNVKFGVSTRLKHVPLRLSLLLDNLQKFDLRYNDPNNVTTDPITGEKQVTEETFVNNVMRHVVLAAEMAPSKNFNLQLGYDFRRGFEMSVPTRRSSAGLTFGIGLKVSKFRVNYANTNMNVAGRMHHIGITTSLDRFKKKKS